MHRRFSTVLLAITIAAVPITAQATVSPDVGYGDAGLATFPTDCTGNTLYRVAEYVGYDGRVYVLEQCGSGYHRVAAIDDHGHVDTGFGTSGRVTFKVPAACLGESEQLVTGKDGSVYALFWGLSAKPGYQSLTDEHACIARITPAGDLAAHFGGTGPIRRLNIANDGYMSLRGGAVDEAGRLLVFSDKYGGDWPYRAVFINRYTLSGRPDRTFSSDGQRAYTQRFQEQLESFGVLGNRPVVAIQSHYTGDMNGPVGTAFIRFSAVGRMDTTFSGDGKVYVKSTELAGGSTYGFVIDEHDRLTYAVRGAQPYHYSTWIDLRRIGPTGINDAAFASATAKIQAPPHKKLAYPNLFLTNAHYAVNWETTDNDSRTTGFNGNGTRWTALGTNGTFKPDIIPAFAPDRSAFYWFTGTGASPDEEAIYRRLVQ